MSSLVRARTKIICTLGPAVASYEKIEGLIEAGMNVARLNFSHGTHLDHLKNIELIKQARAAKGVPLAIMLDTKGPEVRVGDLPQGALLLEQGKQFKIPQEIPITPASVLAKVEVGSEVLFDDGYIIAKVAQKTEAGIVIEMMNTGTLKSHKGVYLPHVDTGLPDLTEQDRADIRFGCKNDVDIIAASFVRSARHILEIRELLAQEGKSDTLVFAKIESNQGTQHFEEILAAADGIMVARGDLGVELPLKRVPSLQKMMIRKSYEAAKPVVTATQMLESMIHNPRPTRAEVSDVANAIYDSTSCVMLSGETAVGEYPIETVKMMRSIIEEAEKDFPYRDFFSRNTQADRCEIPASVALAAVKTAYSARAKALFVFTTSGESARLLASFRPEMPIIALTSLEKTYHQLSTSFGVIPAPCKRAGSAQEALEIIASFAQEKGLVQAGDTVVITAGIPFGQKGSTNIMMVEKIGGIAPSSSTTG